MTLLIQHGYGKADKIEHTLDIGISSGVVLSPQYETVANLAAYIAYIRNNYDALVAVDPQFYACTVADGKVGNLVNYPYFPDQIGIRELSSPRNISGYVRATVDFQLNLSVSHLIAPTVYVDNLDSRWAAIANLLAAESADYHLSTADEREMLVSVVVSENCLTSKEAIDDFLDELTTLDVAGFYIVVARSGNSWSQDFSSQRLTNLLHFVYSLSVINEYVVFCGYSDYVSIPLRAAGADYVANGWFSSQRRFSMERFVPKRGGRQPNPRYSSLPLLGTIQISPEMVELANRGFLRDIHTGTNYDSDFLQMSPDAVDWPSNRSTMHHWSCLRSALDTLDSLPSYSANLDWITDSLGRSAALHDRIADSVPIAIERVHVTNWYDAILEFRDMHDI